MVILAHQGGWDEALFVIGPLLFIVALLRMAKNRADRANRERSLTTDPTAGTQPGSAPEHGRSPDAP